MTKEEMELLKPIVREIMSRSDRNVTDLLAMGWDEDHLHQNGTMNISPRMRQPRLWIR